MILEFFIQSTDHNVVDVFGFPAEAGMEKVWCCLCKMLNLTDQHGFQNENRSSTSCLSDICRGHWEATGHSRFWNQDLDTISKGQGSPKWHLGYICLFPVKQWEQNALSSLEPPQSGLDDGRLSSLLYEDSSFCTSLRTVLFKCFTSWKSIVAHNFYL